MRLPDFLIIGAAKSGTTSLYKYLSRHPQIHKPTKEGMCFKEPNFFGNDEIYAKGLNWYASLFEDAQPDELCGEASTDYTKWPQYPDAAERIYQTLPQVKLIYVMRHPVQRAYSYYVHLGRNKKIQETFEEHLKRTSVSLEASYYLLQIEKYLAYFKRDAFLFLFMDDLIKAPHETLRRVCQFLEIDDTIDLVGQNSVVANQSKQFFSDTIRGKITGPLRSIPGVYNLASHMPQSWRDWVYDQLQHSFYGSWVKQQYTPPPMLPETYQSLLEHFREPNQKLAEFLDCDLSHWDLEPNKDKILSRSVKS